MNIFDILKERGFIAQCTDNTEVYKLLNEKSITFYIGFDPTADSLHSGHLIALMTMAHMQRAGHRPICLIGGGTGIIGDPSGRSDLRKVITDDMIEHNCSCLKEQISHFIDFNNDKALIVNNGNWLRKLNYIDILREVGAHFTVNRMLTAECYKQRWEKGLTFLEFNYMIMQAYDFYKLYNDYNCVLEMGGDDQWSNIIAGIELVKRKTGNTVWGLTNKLLLKSDGTKMGKTAKGAIWLDKQKTSPYNFYQYWRNIDDVDVENCLKLLTFLSINEINNLCAYKDKRINEAKEVLAYEVTKLVHGEDIANQVHKTSIEIFTNQNFNNIPIFTISNNINNLLDILVNTNVIKSKAEGRRLISQNGLTLNDKKVTDINYTVSKNDLQNNSFIIRKGKKNYYKYIFS